MSHRELRVPVNDDLVLDAGTCEPVSGPNGPEILVHPPAKTLFHQVLEYLQSKPDPPWTPCKSRVGREGVAAAAVSIRWGSWFAVLADRTKPVWPEAVSAHSEASRISDGEMARINIEASAALAEWIDLFRSHEGMGLYASLVDRAIAYLPMPSRNSKRGPIHFEVLSYEEIAGKVVAEAAPEALATARADAEHHASRIFANALVNFAWRNGPVEEIHAGRCRGYPLAERRITPKDERDLFRSTSSRMASGMTAMLHSVMERSRSWPEQALPYALSPIFGITPSGWTLTETTRKMRLAMEVPSCEF